MRTGTFVTECCWRCPYFRDFCGDIECEKTGKKLEANIYDIKFPEWCPLEEKKDE